MIRQPFFCLTLILSFWSHFLPAQSRIKIDSLTHALGRTQNTVEKMDIMYYLSEEWAELDFDSSFYYASRLFETARENHNDLYLIYGYRMIGVAYDYHYEMDSAHYYYNLALEKAVELKDSAQIGVGYFNLGTLELLQGKYIKVLPHYEKALAIFEKIPGSKYRLVKIYNNLAIVYRRIRRHEDAVRLYQKAIRILDKEKDPENLLNVYINIGNAYNSTGRYDSAQYYFDYVYNYTQQTEDRLNFYYASNGMGMVEDSRGNPEAALMYFKPAAEDQSIEDKNVIFTARRYMADIYSRLGRYDMAEKYFHASMAVLDSAESPDQVKELYLQLSAHLERTGDLHGALTYLKKHYEVKDKLISQEVIDRTSEWEERFQNQEKTNQIIALKLKNEEASFFAQQQRNQRNVFILISLTLLVVVGFAVYLYRTKQMSSRILAEKNQIIGQALVDKELLMKEVHHRAKNNLQVITSLLNLQAGYTSDSGAVAAILESKNRVHSMVLIHQRLYRYENLTEIEVKEYLEQLIANLERSYEDPDREITVETDIDPVMMEVDTVILLGLIVNELLTNSFKYAFEGRNEGNVRFRLKREGEQMIMEASDDGIGMAAPPDVQQGSLGTLLVTDLAKKLKGELHYDLTKGTCVKLRFGHKKTIG